MSVPWGYRAAVDKEGAKDGMASAIEYWKNRVETHHDQSLRTQAESSWSSDDMWRPILGLFKADPRRTDDPVLNRLCQMVTSATTILDVGGGAGRFALPLALRCRHLTVVEPSESMVEELREGAKEAGIKNLSVVQGLWEESQVDPADKVLCAHVVYGVAEIEPFIRKLQSHARERVVLLAFMECPISRLSPFWKPVHGEERLDLPGAPELLNALWEMDIYPDLEMFEETSPEAVESREAAVELLRQFLYVKPDTEKDRRLQAALGELLVETPDGFTVRESRPRRQALIGWSPA